jgi:streptogrisin C
VLVAAVGGFGYYTWQDRAELPEELEQAQSLVEAMQRDLGLDVDEVAEVFEEQAQARSELADLREALGDDFGGAEFDLESRDLIVSVTDSEAAEVVENAGALPRVVDHGEQALQSAVESLNMVDPSTSAAWYPLLEEDAVVIEVPPGQSEAGETLALNAGVDLDMVRIDETDIEYQTSDLAPEEPGETDIVGGLSYTTPEGRCSVGFSVAPLDDDFVPQDPGAEAAETPDTDQDEAESPEEGDEEGGGKDPVDPTTVGFATAGHCGGVGVPTQTPDGMVEGSVFPGPGDYAWVSSDWNATPLVSQHDAEGFAEVAGLQESPIGAAVCRSGATTGWHCGVVEAFDVTVNYQGGMTVHGLTATSVCTEPGDSGGPYISDTQAQGVTSGGSVDGCAADDAVSFFQPLIPLLTEFDLALVTASGPVAP